MKPEKQVTIESMDVYLSKVTVKREGPKDVPKISKAYLTFAVPLPEEKLVEFGLSDIARDPRFKMGEEIILSEMKQGLQGTINLVVALVAPVTGEAKPVIEAPAMLTKMTLTGEIFGFEVGYTVCNADDWVTFGNLFQDHIGMGMVVSAIPDNRGKQEHFKQEHVDRVATGIGETLGEGDSVTVSSPGKKPVTVKGKKKVKKNADKKS